MKREITALKENGGSQDAAEKEKRRYPVGAELVAPEELSFRVWAPKAKTIDVALEISAKSAERSFHPMTREGNGYFSASIKGGAGTCYRFRVDGGEHFYPDPVSRFQPHGPHGSSCVIDPLAFKWSDANWRGRPLKGQIFYEMHVGTFTKEGTWAAAAAQLEELARIGITVIEMMPIADFPGNFGWGYDGVNLFAPTRLYGTPDDLRSFIDRAHTLNLSVILDVVYNHFGPDGNYLRAFSEDYFTPKHENDWGESINFDGPNSGPVREFYITNGLYWTEEFHFDGFRFDATQDVHDESDEYIIGAIGRAARAAAGVRTLILVAENEPQETKLVQPRSAGGDDLDGVWNDDLHHAALVALTGRNEAYYTDYLGAPQEFISAAKYGYLFQGQPYTWQEGHRGTPTFGLPPETFVGFIENHDQVSNSARGERIRFLTSPGRYRAMTALILLGPWTPLLFQGQEFGASSPFLFFTDVGDQTMKEAIREGRFSFLRQFPSMVGEETQRCVPAPDDPDAYMRCKLDFTERQTNRFFYDLHIDLMHLRHNDSCFSTPGADRVDGAVLGQASFVLRYFGSDHTDDRLLVMNLGRRQILSPAPEPLLAPPIGLEWETVWTSESAKYGGLGAVDIVTEDRWTFPAEAAAVLRLAPEKKPRRRPQRRKF
jgi:maltooligosyltrehalose trehalohydrolase